MGIISSGDRTSTTSDITYISEKRSQAVGDIESRQLGYVASLKAFAVNLGAHA
jgi:hypothetical protein